MSAQHTPGPWRAEPAGPANDRVFMVGRRVNGDYEFILDEHCNIRHFPSLVAAQAAAAIENAKASGSES